MKIRVTIIGHIVVDYDINALDIDAPPKYVRSHHNTVFEVFESLIVFDPEFKVKLPFALLKMAMDADTRESVISQK